MVLDVGFGQRPLGNGIKARFVLARIAQVLSIIRTPIDATVCDLLYCLLLPSIVGKLLKRIDSSQKDILLAAASVVAP